MKKKAIIWSVVVAIFVLLNVIYLLTYFNFKSELKGIYTQNSNSELAFSKIEELHQENINLVNDYQVFVEELVSLKEEVNSSMEENAQLRNEIEYNQRLNGYIDYSYYLLLKEMNKNIIPLSMNEMFIGDYGLNTTVEEYKKVMTGKKISNGLYMLENDTLVVEYDVETDELRKISVKQGDFKIGDITIQIGDNFQETIAKLSSKLKIRLDEAQAFYYNGDFIIGEGDYILKLYDNDENSRSCPNIVSGIEIVKYEY